MRIFLNARAIGRINGMRAFWRTFAHGCRHALARQLDELVALLLLIRSKLLKKGK